MARLIVVERKATMATRTPAIKFTYQDYRNAPEDKRYELLDGDLVMTPAPRVSHQRVVRKLGTLLTLHVERFGEGEVFFPPCDVVLSDTDVVQPDLLFISGERSHIITEENVQGAPDLVVEILSPTTAERDQTFKRSLYARHGVKEYWLVDTAAQTVTILLLGPHDFAELSVCGVGQSIKSPTLQGFVLKSDKIFTR